MKLNDAECRAAKPAAELYKLSDDGGLQLWVAPSGSRTWRLAYRYNGQQRTLTFGTYPDMKLSEARSRRDEVKRTLRDGGDPAKRTADAPILFEKICLERFEAAKGEWTQKHQDRVESRMNMDIIPALGQTDIREIKGPNILEAVRKIEGRGAYDMAKRVRQNISRIFEFAIAQDIVEHDPASKVKKAMAKGPKRRRRATVPPSEVGDLLRRIKVYNGDPITRLALLFTLHTMVRTTETRFAVWTEFENLDGAEPIWRIPPERMKNGLEHIVPLSPQVIRILDDVRRHSPKNSPWVFPGESKLGVLSENTMLYAMYGMGYHGKATVHGLRTTASTTLNESTLFNSDWIERQLSHVEDNEVRAAYNAAEWLTPRRTMMAWWSALLESKTPAD